jgi:hypothetical protein
MKQGKAAWMPSWAQRLQWLSYVGFIALAALIFNDPWDHPYISTAVFLILAFPIMVRVYFKVHAVARGEVSWSTELGRRSDLSDGS